MQRPSFLLNPSARWPRFAPAHLLLSFLCLALTACDEQETAQPTTRARVPVLTASEATLQLRQAQDNQTALTFTWTPGANGGTNAAIVYTVQFDRQGSNFASPVEVEMGKGVYTSTYRVADLNTLLMQELQLPAGTAAGLEARVKSMPLAEGAEAVYSNAVALTVTPYQAVSETLFLVGSATPNGLDAANATPLERSPNNATVFTYMGPLTPGGFTFITALDQMLPAYTQGADAGTLLYRTDGGQPDESFTVETPGTYLLTVNLETLTLTLQQQLGPAYERLWIVGDATPVGWSIDQADALQQDPTDPFLFSYNEVLKAGDFKIATALNWDAPFYRPLTNYPALSVKTVQVSAGDPDHKWKITEPGPYKITLNLRNNTVNIVPFAPYPALWMVGDATPAGWNIDAPQPMTPDADNPYVFTYTGPLTAGEFKIPTSTGNWGTDFFMPPVNHAGTGEQMAKFTVGGNPDNKWLITEAGNYRVTLNQLYETINIERQ